MSASTTLLPFQPASMSTAQLAAVSYLSRYSGPTPHLYAYQQRRWCSECQSNGLDPLVGIQRARRVVHPPPGRVRADGRFGDHDDAWNPRAFRFGHIDGLISADPAVYAGLTQVHRDESRTQGSDRLELIRFLQVAQAIAVHHGVLEHLLRIKALRASEPVLGRDFLLWRVWDH